MFQEGLPLPMEVSQAGSPDLGGAVPQNEIAQVPSLAGIRVLAKPDFFLGPASHVQPIEFAEPLEFQRVKKNVPLVTVGVTFIHEPLD